jgi:hypothetical protein
MKLDPPTLIGYPRSTDLVEDVKVNQNKFENVECRAVLVRHPLEL